MYQNNTNNPIGKTNNMGSPVISLQKTTKITIFYNNLEGMAANNFCRVGITI